MLVEAGPNAELRRLVFSNAALLLSFLRLNNINRLPVADALSESRRSTDKGRGGRRLNLAAPVAGLMGVLVEGDAELATCVSDEHLTLLVRGTARSR